MDGLFGVAGHDEIVGDLFPGTDYHSHPGTKRPAPGPALRLLLGRGGGGLTSRGRRDRGPIS
jgi:hypothetical protein